MAQYPSHDHTQSQERTHHNVIDHDVSSSVEPDHSFPVKYSSKGKISPVPSLCANDQEIAASSKESRVRKK